MTTLADVQRAIFTRLANDAELDGLTTGVFDEVPQGTSFPYVTIGELSEVGFDTFDRTGSEDTITIHIWSTYRGNKEILSILDRVNALLDGATFAVAGHHVVGIEYESGVTSHEPDTRHFIARYRLRVQEG